eukprot:2382-Heterococcus_DN1.PRE.1
MAAVFSLAHLLFGVVEACVPAAVNSTLAQLARTVLCVLHPAALRRSEHIQTALSQRVAFVQLLKYFCCYDTLSRSFDCEDWRTL